MAASLPATLAVVPIRASAVTMAVGDSTPSAAPVRAATQARKATPQPRSAFISSVCTQ